MLAVRWMSEVYGEYLDRQIDITPIQYLQGSPVVENPRKLTLHRDHLMPPLVIVFEKFEENI